MSKGTGAAFNILSLSLVRIVMGPTERVDNFVHIDDLDLRAFKRGEESISEEIVFPYLLVESDDQHEPDRLTHSVELGFLRQSRLRGSRSHQRITTSLPVITPQSQQTDQSYSQLHHPIWEHCRWSRSIDTGKKSSTPLSHPRFKVDVSNHDTQCSELNPIAEIRDDSPKTDSICVAGPRPFQTLNRIHRHRLRMQDAILKRFPLIARETGTRVRHIQGLIKYKLQEERKKRKAVFCCTKSLHCQGYQREIRDRLDTFERTTSNMMRMTQDIGHDEFLCQKPMDELLEAQIVEATLMPRKVFMRRLCKRRRLVTRSAKQAEIICKNELDTNHKLNYPPLDNTSEEDKQAKRMWIGRAQRLSGSEKEDLLKEVFDHEAAKTTGKTSECLADGVRKEDVDKGLLEENESEDDEGEDGEESMAKDEDGEEEEEHKGEAGIGNGKMETMLVEEKNTKDCYICTLVNEKRRWELLKQDVITAYVKAKENDQYLRILTKVWI